MARIRTIKPEFFTSLTLADVSLSARLTFIGLWTHCDDEGRCVADGRLVKAALWPLEDEVTAEVVVDHLSELADFGLVEMYMVDGRLYLQVNGWTEHQRINRPTPSKLPPPSDGEPAPPPQPPLTEDSRGEGKGKEQGGEQGNTLSPDGDDEIIDQFEQHFWPTYPTTNGRKPEKAKALQQWKRLTVEQRRRALIGARNLAKADTIPKHAHRFLRKDTAGAFPFDDWQSNTVAVVRAGPHLAVFGTDEYEAQQERLKREREALVERDTA